MNSGSVAIKKDMKKIYNVSYKDNVITFYTSDENEYSIQVVADSIIGLDNLFETCIDKTLIRITYDSIVYDDSLHPFESVVTYCGGIMEWFTYRSYTFHFDDETCSTIELSYSTPEAEYPQLIFID